MAMTPELPDRWPSALAEHRDLRDRLLAAYSGTDRGYHDQRHLTEVLDHLDLLLAAHPEVDRDTVVLAAWFHDAVYTGAAGADEESSAALAERELATVGAAPALVREVARLVRLTAAHRPAADDRAGQVLCDADLAILAAPPWRYATYVAGVRREYADVPDPDFRAGRAAVLRDLLAGPRLFSIPAARERWEDVARRNVGAEIAALDDVGAVPPWRWAAEIVRHHDPANARLERVGAGATPGPIAVVPADPAWPEVFSRVRARIVSALGPSVVDVAHVGSTSVPGLPAKPVIDVDLTVADPADEAAYVPALREAGFRLVLREPGWHEHRVLRLDEPAANVHVFGPRCPESIRMRMFRDWLRTHPADLAAYRDAKRAAATDTTARGGDVQDYNRHKEAVLRAIYDRMFRAHGLL